MKSTARMVLALALGTVAGTAQAQKDCAELKSEIEAKLQARGVQNYSLDIVAAGDAGSAKVVGSCDGGAGRIVYGRGGSGGAAAAAPSAGDHAGKASVTRKSAPPPAIGNY